MSLQGRPARRPPSLRNRTAGWVLVNRGGALGRCPEQRPGHGSNSLDAPGIEYNSGAGEDTRRDCRRHPAPIVARSGPLYRVGPSTEEFKDETSRSLLYEQGAVTPRAVPERLAPRARAGVDLPRERHQVAGPDRVLRPVRGVVEELGEPDGLQACDLHYRPFAQHQAPEGRWGRGKRRSPSP